MAPTITLFCLTLVGMEVKESSSEDAVAYSSYLIDPAINLRKTNE